MSVEENSSVPRDNEDKSQHSSSEDEETVEVEGFQVPISKENQVKEMFKDHPYLVSDFDIQNKQLKNAYMDVLLNQIETLSRSSDLVSLDDIYDVDNTLLELTRAGFKVEWLRKRLDEAYVKKEKQKVSTAKIKELEKLVKKRKLNLSELESHLKKEKAAVASAAAAAEAVPVAASSAVAKVGATKANFGFSIIV